MSALEIIADDIIPEHKPVLSFANEALALVLKERARQDDLWGEQNHSPERWLRILTEENGEAAKEMDRDDERFPFSPNLQYEITQVAAVALAMLECCLRNDWCGGRVE